MLYICPAKRSPVTQDLCSQSLQVPIGTSAVRPTQTRTGQARSKKEPRKLAMKTVRMSGSL
eukprot:1575649-Amphidinium_carterae.1